MKSVLKEMLIIYNNPKRDWMNYKVTNSNPFTYHHIRKEEHGGKGNIDNGAILTKKAHTLLHIIEMNDIEIYNSLNNILKEINIQRYNPTEKQRELIELLLVKFELNNYKIIVKGNKGKKKKLNLTDIRHEIQDGQDIKIR